MRAERRHFFLTRQLFHPPVTAKSLRGQILVKDVNNVLVTKLFLINYHSSVKSSLLQKLSWPFLVTFPAPRTQTTMVARHCQWLLMSQKRTSHCSSRGLFLILCFVCEMKEGLNLYNRVILNLGFLASTSCAVIVLGLFPPAIVGMKPRALIL